MKVLHVIPSFAARYGGPIVAVQGLTKELASQGHNVTVMTTNADGPGVLDVPLGRAVDLEGVDVWYFPVERPRWYFFSAPLGRAVRRRVGDFDIVHIHSVYLWSTTIAAFWCRRRGVPYLIQPAGFLDPVSLRKPYVSWPASIPSRMKKWIYLNTVGKWDLKRASGIHYASEAEMEAAQALKLRAPGYVLSLGVDPPPTGRDDHGSALRSRYPELKNKRIVLFLSRLDPIKGLDILVSALADLSAKRDDFVLAVAGSGNTAYEREVASLVRNRGLQEIVVFLGFLQGAEKWSVLLGSDVFVLPSHHENFGVAVVEAMAAGLPVVISDRVNIHQEVEAAGAGIVTGLEPREVAVAVDKLLSDEGLRSEMGAAGARLVRERFSWDVAARKILQAYQDIVSSSRGAPLDAVPSARA